jgi:hypothetical protein
VPCQHIANGIQISASLLGCLVFKDGSLVFTLCLPHFGKLHKTLHHTLYIAQVRWGRIVRDEVHCIKALIFQAVLTGAIGVFVVHVVMSRCAGVASYLNEASLHQACRCLPTCCLSCFVCVVQVRWRRIVLDEAHCIAALWL